LTPKRFHINTERQGISTCLFSFSWTGGIDFVSIPCQGQEHGPFFYLCRCRANPRLRTLLLKDASQEVLQNWTESPGLIGSWCAGVKTCPMNKADSSKISHFMPYAQKRFDRALLAGGFTGSRSQPDIPFRSVWWVESSPG